jgi:hypothetical protein
MCMQVQKKKFKSMGALLHEISTLKGGRPPVVSWEPGPNKEFMAVLKIDENIFRGCHPISKNAAKNAATELALRSLCPRLLETFVVTQSCSKFEPVPVDTPSDSAFFLPDQLVKALRASMHGSHSFLCSSSEWSNDNDSFCLLSSDTTESIKQ